MLCVVSIPGLRRCSDQRAVASPTRPRPSRPSSKVAFRQRGAGSPTGDACRRSSRRRTLDTVIISCRWRTLRYAWLIAILTTTSCRRSSMNRSSSSTIRTNVYMRPLSEGDLTEYQIADLSSTNKLFFDESHLLMVGGYGTKKRRPGRAVRLLRCRPTADFRPTTR